MAKKVRKKKQPISLTVKTVLTGTALEVTLAEKRLYQEDGRVINKGVIVNRLFNFLLGQTNEKVLLNNTPTPLLKFREKQNNAGPAGI